MGSLVSEDDVAAFARNGAVVLRGVFSDEWVRVVEAGISRNLQEPSDRSKYADPTSQRFFQDSDNWTRIPEFRDFVMNSPAKRIAADLMHAHKINFIHDHVLVKKAGANKRTLWHQDQPYSPFEGRDFCTMWMPVDPVSQATALEFIAGSQRSGKWYRPQHFSSGELREGDDPRWEVLPEIEKDRSSYEILRWGVEPGDVLVFAGLTLHGAPGNETLVDRRVLSTRWAGDDIRFQRRSGAMSPPPPAEGAPADGAPIDCDAFPVVWRAQ